MGNLQSLPEIMARPDFVAQEPDQQFATIDGWHKQAAALPNISSDEDQLGALSDGVSQAKDSILTSKFHSEVSQILPEPLRTPENIEATRRSVVGAHQAINSGGVGTFSPINIREYNGSELDVIVQDASAGKQLPRGLLPSERAKVQARMEELGDPVGASVLPSASDTGSEQGWAIPRGNLIPVVINGPNGPTVANTVNTARIPRLADNPKDAQDIGYRDTFIDQSTGARKTLEQIENHAGEAEQTKRWQAVTADDSGTLVSIKKKPDPNSNTWQFKIAGSPAIIEKHFDQHPTTAQLHDVVNEYIGKLDDLPLDQFRSNLGGDPTNPVNTRIRLENIFGKSNATSLTRQVLGSVVRNASEIGKGVGGFLNMLGQDSINDAQTVSQQFPQSLIPASARVNTGQWLKDTGNGMIEGAAEAAQPFTKTAEDLALKPGFHLDASDLADKVVGVASGIGQLYAMGPGGFAIASGAEKAGNDYLDAYQFHKDQGATDQQASENASSEATVSGLVNGMLMYGSGKAVMENGVASTAIQKAVRGQLAGIIAKGGMKSTIAAGAANVAAAMPGDVGLMYGMGAAQRTADLTLQSLARGNDYPDATKVITEALGDNGRWQDDVLTGVLMAGAFGPTNPRGLSKPVRGKYDPIQSSDGTNVIPIGGHNLRFDNVVEATAYGKKLQRMEDVRTELFDLTDPQNPKLKSDKTQQQLEAFRAEQQRVEQEFQQHRERDINNTTEIGISTHDTYTDAVREAKAFASSVILDRTAPIEHQAKELTERLQDQYTERDRDWAAERQRFIDNTQKANPTQVTDEGKGLQAQQSDIQNEVNSLKPDDPKIPDLQKQFAALDVQIRAATSTPKNIVGKDLQTAADNWIASQKAKVRQGYKGKAEYQANLAFRSPSSTLDTGGISSTDPSLASLNAAVVNNLTIDPIDVQNDDGTQIRKYELRFKSNDLPDVLQPSGQAKQLGAMARQDGGAALATRGVVKRRVKPAVVSPTPVADAIEQSLPTDPSQYFVPPRAEGTVLTAREQNAASEAASQAAREDHPLRFQIEQTVMGVTGKSAKDAAAIFEKAFANDLSKDASEQSATPNRAKGKTKTVQQSTAQEPGAPTPDESHPVIKAALEESKAATKKRTQKPKPLETPEIPAVEPTAAPAASEDPSAIPQETKPATPTTAKSKAAEPAREPTTITLPVPFGTEEVIHKGRQRFIRQSPDDGAWVEVSPDGSQEQFLGFDRSAAEKRIKGEDGAPPAKTPTEWESQRVVLEDGPTKPDVQSTGTTEAPKEGMKVKPDMVLDPRQVHAEIDEEHQGPGEVWNVKIGDEPVKLLSDDEGNWHQVTDASTGESTPIEGATNLKEALTAVAKEKGVGLMERPKGPGYRHEAGFFMPFHELAWQALNYITGNKPFGEFMRDMGKKFGTAMRAAFIDSWQNVARAIAKGVDKLLQKSVGASDRAWAKRGQSGAVDLRRNSDQDVLDAMLNKSDPTSPYQKRRNDKMAGQMYGLSSSGKLSPKAIKDMHSKYTQGAFGEWLDRKISTAQSEAARMHPILGQVMTHWQWTNLEAAGKWNQAFNGLFRGLKAMKGADATEWYKAQRNGDTVTFDRLMAKYSNEKNGDMQAHWRDAQATFKEIRDRGNAAGLDIGEIADYFPSSLKNYKNFRQWANNSPYVSDLDALKSDFTKKNGRPPTQDEADEIANNFLSRQWQSMGKSGFMKGRTINNWDIADIVGFYHPPHEVLQNYVHSMARAVTTAEFFGHDAESAVKEGNLSPEQLTKNIPVDAGSHVGRVLNDLTAEDNPHRLTSDEVDRFYKIISSVIGYKPSPKFSRLVSQSNVALALNNPITNLGQLPELAMAAYRSGVFNTVGSSFSSVAGQTTLKAQDLHLGNSMEIEAPRDHIGKAVSFVATWSGLRPLDHITARVVADTYLKKLQGMSDEQRLNALEPVSRFLKYGKEAVSELIKQGDWKNDDVRWIAFNELSQVRPMSMVDMPRSYLNHPGARILWNLRVFGVKQLDALRVASFDQINGKHGGLTAANIGKGLQGLVHLGGFLLAAGLTKDKVQDYMLGRKTSLGNAVIDNALKLILGSKYQSDKLLKTGSTWDFITNMVHLPLINVVDQLARTGLKGAQNLKYGDGFFDGMTPKLLKQVPGFGQWAYWAMTDSGQEDKIKMAQNDYSNETKGLVDEHTHLLGKGEAARKANGQEQRYRALTNFVNYKHDVEQGHKMLGQVYEPGMLQFLQASEHDGLDHSNINKAYDLINDVNAKATRPDEWAPRPHAVKLKF